MNPTRTASRPPGAVLVIDIGATKIAVGMVNGVPEILGQLRTPTPTECSAEQLWNVVATAVGRLLSTAPAVDLLGVGIGSGGPLDPAAGTVSPLLIPAWRDFPIVDRAARLVDAVPVTLLGDGVCTALGEHWAGAGRGVANMLGMVVSSGVGGGLILDGRIRAGPTGNAGHIGHLVVDQDGPGCPCGGRGCVEGMASGPSMVSWAQRAGWRPDQPAPTAVHLAAAARAGEPVPVAAFGRAGRALAAMIASVAAVCELDRVVVGGGVAQTGALLFDAIDVGLREFAGLGFVRRVGVHPAALGTDAGLIGAAGPLLQPERYGDAAPGR